MAEAMDRPKQPPMCELCGDPMPAGEEMFKYHGYSGPCPKPPLPSAMLPDPQPLSAQLQTARSERDELLEQRDELLAALKDLVDCFEIRNFVRPAVARARQVIAKAEGK